MTYSIKEMFYTLQGEGAQAGRAAVFMRFTGCNLWTGRESDRKKAICKFCDTDFVGTDGTNGGKFKSAEALAMAASQVWMEGAGQATTSEGVRALIVCTGGEPLLQMNAELIYRLHQRGFEVAVETNGTIPIPRESLEWPGGVIDWVCVSPKADAPLKQISGNELKLVYPQVENKPEDFQYLSFTNFFLQPKDDEHQEENIKAAVQYCLDNPRWRLSLQTHKIVGLR